MFDSPVQPGATLVGGTANRHGLRESQDGPCRQIGTFLVFGPVLHREQVFGFKRDAVERLQAVLCVDRLTPRLAIADQVLGEPLLERCFLIGIEDGAPLLLAELANRLVHP
jgi:hypothetical protein